MVYFGDGTFKMSETAAAFLLQTVTISEMVFFGTSGCKMSNMASSSSLTVTIPEVVFLGTLVCKMSDTNCSRSDEGCLYMRTASCLL